MNTSFIIFIVIALVCIISIRNIYEKKKNKPDSTNEDTVKTEMEEIFFERVGQGAVSYRIASLFNQFDIMFIKSLFQNEQIPYYFEFENMAKIKSGLPIESFNNSILNVLDEDYKDAIQVLEEYESNKDLNKSSSNRIRNAAELIIGGWSMPSPKEKSIEIYYKSTEEKA